MKGYRTIITNVVMAIASFGVMWGIEIPAEDVTSVTNGIISVFTVVNLILRKATTTSIGKSE